MPDQTIQHNLTKSVVADGADENALPTRLRRLIDENPRGARRKRSGVGSQPLVTAVPGRANELDQEVADTADFCAAGHEKPTLEVS